MEEENKVSVVRPDTPEDIQNTDLVQLSRKLLGSVVDATGMLNLKEMTPDKLKEAKTVLGFLNATTSAVKAKMQFFKMAGIGDKVSALEKKSEEL